MAKHSLDFWLTSEDLPDPNNRVTLDAEGGIILSYKPNNEEGHKRLTAKLKELMQHKLNLQGARPRLPRRPLRAQSVRRPKDPASRRCASSRHGALRQRS